MTFRLSTWLVSLLLHATLGWQLVRNHDQSAYSIGWGSDDFVVEQGVAIENAVALGRDTETVEAIEAEPVEMSEARAEIEEVEAEEQLTEEKVIGSQSGPEQEELPDEAREAVEQPKQTATLEHATEAPQEERLAAGAAKSGGDASAVRAYEGRLFSHIQRRIVRPRAGQRAGRVVVRFTVDPSGQVLSREVAESSGIKGIDEAALATIDRASPFPPIPIEVADGPLVRTVPIRYRVE